MSDNEKIADIVAEMRRIGLPRHDYTAGDMEADRWQFADRIEAAWKRERESIAPQPDTDWKDICEKCNDGEIEPKFCAYYGEPNGCNSPIYGEHPTTEKSSAVGNAAKLREALKNLIEVIDECDSGSPLWWHSGAKGVMPLKNAKAALAEPPRNCDVSRLAWDNVVPALCDEVVALRKQIAAKDEALKDCKVFLGETIQCGVEGEMLDGRHVNVAASDLADKVDDVLKGVGQGRDGGDGNN